MPPKPLTRAVLSAFLVVGAIACDRRSPTSGEAPPTSSAPTPPSSSAPQILPASSSREDPIACGAACAPGTACRLTKAGPACVACAPGSAPTCKDDRFLATCSEDGALLPATDCAAQKKRCDRGRCIDRECTPNALHCFEGDVYRCNADGSARTLATKCVTVDPDGSIDASKGLCQEKKGTPACRTKCNLPDHAIVAVRDCGACAWDDVAFCATESPERSCSDWICLPGGDMGFGAVAIPCVRDTDGLVVPNSEKQGACEGPGSIGTRAITYDVCRGGRPAPVTRTEPCRK